MEKTLVAKPFSFTANGEEEKIRNTTQRKRLSRLVVGVDAARSSSSSSWVVSRCSLNPTHTKKESFKLDASGETRRIKTKETRPWPISTRHQPPAMPDVIQPSLPTSCIKVCCMVYNTLSRCCSHQPRRAR